MLAKCCTPLLPVCLGNRVARAPQILLELATFWVVALGGVGGDLVHCLFVRGGPPWISSPTKATSGEKADGARPVGAFKFGKTDAHSAPPFAPTRGNELFLLTLYDSTLNLGLDSYCVWDERDCSGCSVLPRIATCPSSLFSGDAECSGVLLGIHLLLGSCCSCFCLLFLQVSFVCLLFRE